MELSELMWRNVYSKSNWWVTAGRKTHFRDTVKAVWLTTCFEKMSKSQAEVLNKGERDFLFVSYYTDNSEPASQF